MDPDLEPQNLRLQFGLTQDFSFPQKREETRSAVSAFRRVPRGQAGGGPAQRSADYGR